VTEALDRHRQGLFRLPPQSFARDLLGGWREAAARTWVGLIVVSAG
jgi:hypothetical protein